MTAAQNDQLIRLKKLYELSMELSGDPMDIFFKVARMIGEIMDMKVVCLSEIQDEMLYFISVYVEGQVYLNAGCCSLDITPCATVQETKDIRIYDNVMALFPKAVFLKEHNACFYCGFPSLGYDENVVAVTCLLDDKPHEISQEDKELLRIFGQRIGLELERKRLQQSRQAMEENLLLERNRLRQIMDSVSIFIALLDSEGKVIEANRAPWAIAGITREEYIGIQFGESRAWTYNPAIHAQVRLAVLQARQGIMVRYDVPILMANSIVTIDFSLVPVFDEQDQVKQIVACGVDISIRRKALEALRRSEERLELAIAGADLGLWDWNIKTGAIEFSERWASLLGCAPEDMPSSYEAWERLVHPDDRPIMQRALRANLAAKAPFFEIEYRLLTKSGEWKWTLAKGKVIRRSAKGTAMRVSGVNIDISPRKALEEQLRLQQEELFYAQRLTAAGELTAIVAHELNQPLGAINNYVGGALLRFRELLSTQPSLADVLEQILRLSQRAIAVIHGIRALVRKQESRLENIALATVVEEVLIPLRVELNNKQIRVCSEIPTDLPLLWCEKIHLQQLLLNLILNAMQAMDVSECAQRKLRLGAKLNQKREVEITVSDTGPGIAPEIAARLFQPFVSTKADGIGLGLSICRSIAEAYGGHISVRSMLRQGTAFHVVLPTGTEELKK
jgi:PAS domain S-box-containing protein